ncbi:hypothetical protein BSL78_21648 [Apostichopus japonicus]|uniref:Uncharacterized protein n=1 Tax=Stichopus japonicus TaxID=307972 RepID=A0A2G8K0H1_STIJA|nr:hypothetical protein BSL78_21648 [Apostichopus japonicus]
MLGEVLRDVILNLKMLLFSWMLRHQILAARMHDKSTVDRLVHWSNEAVLVLRLLQRHREASTEVFNRHSRGRKYDMVAE